MFSTFSYSGNLCVFHSFFIFLQHLSLLDFIKTNRLVIADSTFKLLFSDVFIVIYFFIISLFLHTLCFRKPLISQNSQLIQSFIIFSKIKIPYGHIETSLVPLNTFSLKPDSALSLFLTSFVILNFYPTFLLLLVVLSYACLLLFTSVLILLGSQFF